MAAIWKTIPRWSVPRDGTRRFLYENWQALTFATLTISSTVIVFATQPWTPSFTDDLFCNVDGNVAQARIGYQPMWDVGLFFAINIAYGELSFTTVKLIDACWDVIVGRLGQGVVGIMAFRVLRRSLALLMEDSVVLVSTATSVCCQQIQLISVWELLRGIFVSPTRTPPLGRRQRLRNATRYAMYVFVCAYVLAFATFVSVMTGYRAMLTGYFQLNEFEKDSLTRLSLVNSTRVALWDGRRIGLPNGLSLPESVELTNVFSRYYSACNRIALGEGFPAPKYPPFEENRTYWGEGCHCKLPAGATTISEMTSGITFGGREWSLSAPPLNVAIWNREGFWTALNGSNGTIWPSLHTNLFFNNTPLGSGTIETIIGRSKCVAEKQYSWGFSSLLLFTFCIYTLGFVLTLVVLQTEVYWFSRVERFDPSYSLYQDILDIAAALNAKFGDDLKGMSGKELHRKIQCHRGGISLMVDDLPSPRAVVRRQQISTLDRELTILSEGEDNHASLVHLNEIPGTARLSSDHQQTTSQSSSYQRLSEDAFDLGQPSDFGR